MEVFALLTRRCAAACTTLPTAAGWKEAALLLLVFSAVALAFGTRTGFLVRQTAPLSARTVAVIAAGVFVSPAFTEEIVFRVLPIPLAGEASETARLTWAAMSLVIFVLYHPARAWLFPKRRAYGVFLDKCFLVLASLLGLCCTVVYLHSGLVWPAVFVHWACVMGWVIFYGGYAKMRPHNHSEVV